MSFAIPKCPILVVCAAVLCFISKVDPDHYFLPSILFKENHHAGNSKYFSGPNSNKDFVIEDNDNNDTKNGGRINNNLRIGGIQEEDDETPKKISGGEGKAESKSNTVDKQGSNTKKGNNKESAQNSDGKKQQEKKSEVAASVFSSRKNIEVEEVVVKNTGSKENKKKSGDGAKKSESNGEKSGTKKDKEGGETSSQLRKKKKAPERTGKPLFILHIGPPKTGTTTLQCELGEKFQELQEENFYYLGTYYAPLCGLPNDHVVEGFSDATRPVLLHCYSDHATEGCDVEHKLDKQWKEFEDIVLSHKEHNVIMSDEMFHHHFAEEDVKRMAKLLNPHWDVRIMYTYRHFYSSLPSMYQQLNDPYATQKGMANAYEKTIWPEDGGFKIHSFRESNHFTVDVEMEKFNYWADSFQWVQVFNMQNIKGDYLPAFLCTMIPESKVLCQDAKNTDASEHKDNDSSSKFLHFDMLAVEAHEQGLLKKSKKTREEVRDAVQDFCKSKDWSFQHFPLDCLSEPELESFLHETLEQAHILQPYFANPRDDGTTIDSEIISGFQKYREKKKFCSVNTKRTLEEHPWRQFFLNLE